MTCTAAMRMWLDEQRVEVVEIYFATIADAGCLRVKSAVDLDPPGFKKIEKANTPAS